MGILDVILTGGVAVAVIEGGVKLLEWVFGRRAARKDKSEGKAEKEQSAVERRLGNLEVGQQVILHDRLKFLGKAYLKDKEISLDDRDDFNKMYDAYHALGGNGNITALKGQIMQLPLK